MMRSTRSLQADVYEDLGVCGVSCGTVNQLRRGHLVRTGCSANGDAVYSPLAQANYTRDVTPHNKTIVAQKNKLAIFSLICLLGSRFIFFVWGKKQRLPYYIQRGGDKV